MLELIYSLRAFDTVACPVFATMFLAAVTTVYVQTETSAQQGQNAMDQYSRFDTSADSGDGGGKRLLKGFANGLIIVSVICTLTFGIVLLYKYRCMKCLSAYMAFSTTVLLGFMGGNLASVFVDRYGVTVDWITFVFLCVNFGLGGTISIFYQKGIPQLINQSYLVAVSVILSWQLAHFNELTCFALLIMLALYDLCAVLTPCGPLKLLVEEMQQPNAPAMAGLLYEANLPVARPPRGGPEEAQGPDAIEAERERKKAEKERKAERRKRSEARTKKAKEAAAMAGAAVAAVITRTASNNPPTSLASTQKYTTVPGFSSVSDESSYSDDDIHPATPNRATEIQVLNVAHVPLAVARVYKLPLTPPEYIPVDHLTGAHGTPVLYETTDQAAARLLLTGPTPTPDDMRRPVTVAMPSNGSRFETVVGEDGAERHLLVDRRGHVRKVLLLDPETGKVYEETDEDDDSDEDDEEGSIKLGLGDFIFYSVLVAKAAMHSFTTFVATILVIVAGLGGTLVLLSVYKAALPALPISIFLGVGFYLATRFVLEPWIQEVLWVPYYV